MATLKIGTFYGTEFQHFFFLSMFYLASTLLFPILSTYFRYKCLTQTEDKVEKTEA